MAQTDLWKSIELYINDATEEDAVRLMAPLGLALIRAYHKTHPVSRRVGEEILLSHFHLLALTLFRRAQKKEGSYDRARGSFTVWVTEHFRRRIGELVAQEVHPVRRSFKTDQRRCRDDSVDAFGYRSMDVDTPAPPFGRDWFWDRVETRLDLERLLRHLPERDRRFLEPMTTGAVHTARELARHWGVSGAAVSKRFSRLRETVACGGLVSL